MVAASSVRSRVALARRDVSTAGVLLGAIFTVSVIARAALAHWHTAPRYFPDEYIYAALSRSLAHGHFEVRDQPAAFYAILQPIVAAPLWRFFPVETAYRLVQLENAIAASLVVIPLWALGKQLRLRPSSIVLTCVFALFVPTLTMIPVTITDFVAYPLVIAAVAAAVRSLDEPTARRQVIFLGFALLATLARVQYFVLVPAYLAGAIAVDRKRVLRRHRVTLLAATPALLVPVLALSGYYSVSSASFTAATLTWIPLEGFLVAAIAGAAIIPGAVAALVRPTSRVEAAFSSVTCVLALALLAESSVSAGAEGRFKERYLFALVPLVALAFGVYVRNRLSHRWIVLLVSGGMIAAAARLPISGYDKLAPAYDSQSMTAAWLLQNHLGADGASLAVASAITAAAVLALLISLRPDLAVLALPSSIGLAAVTTIAAIHVDRSLNAHYADPGWVNRAANGAPVTVVATPSSAPLQLIKQLYWNSSVNREVVLPGAPPTDSYATEVGSISSQGALEKVHGYFLFDESGSQAVFADARHVETNGRYALFHSRGTPHFRVLVENQLSTGWLSPYTRLRVWPGGPTGGGSRARFTLSLPPDAPHRARMSIGTRKFVVHPGEHVPITCVSPKPSLRVILYSPDPIPDRLGRPVTVQMSGVDVSHDSAAPGQSRCSRTTG